MHGRSTRGVFRAWWEEPGRSSGSVARLHVGCGWALRETALQAKLAGKKRAKNGTCRRIESTPVTSWLNGNLFVAQLSQKLIRISRPFRPWATTCSRKPPVRGQWREFQFALHRVTVAIAPAVGLAATLSHWNEIAAALGERRRKRKRQLSKLRSQP